MLSANLFAMNFESWKKKTFLNGWWDAEDIFIKFLSTITKCPHIFLGRKCEAGWEQRGSANKKCVACPPGMYRPQADHLCQLCPKGLYSDQFGSASCVRCPLYHTTRGLGSKKASQCYYHRSATRSRMVDRQKKPARKKGSVEASFMRYYNRWSSRNQQQKRT